MAWFIALVGMIGVFIFFFGSVFCIFKQDKLLLKKFIFGFMFSFAVAFIAVGFAH